MFRRKWKQSIYFECSFLCAKYASRVNCTNISKVSHLVEWMHCYNELHSFHFSLESQFKFVLLISLLPVMLLIYFKRSTSLFGLLEAKFDSFSSYFKQIQFFLPASQVFWFIFQPFQVFYFMFSGVSLHFLVHSTHFPQWLRIFATCSCTFRLFQAFHLPFSGFRINLLYLWTISV